MPKILLCSPITSLGGQCGSAKVVGSNPNQAWNGWNAWVVGALWWHACIGIQRPYRPPPGLLGLIYRLSSGQEIPHFPSLGLFCHGKLHHLPNLWNIFMGRFVKKAIQNLNIVAPVKKLNNLVFFMLVQFDSV